MLKLGCFAGAVILLMGLLALLFFAVEGVWLQGSGSPGTPTGQGDTPVTLMARAMAAHLHGPPSCATCAPDAWYDAQFPPAVLAWGATHCPGCAAWRNGNLQCVVFVLGAYALVHPLPRDGNGDQWWDRYSTPDVRALGYSEIPAGGGQLPHSPGDIMAWSGGQFGHVSIVLSWVAPQGQTPGSITFAQANGQQPIQTLPLAADGTVETANGYWNGFHVQGYIHPAWLPTPTVTLAGGSPGVAGHVVRLPQLSCAQYTSVQECATWSGSTCSTASIAEVLNAYGAHLRIQDVLQVEAALGAITPALGLVRPSGIAETAARFGMRTQWDTQRSPSVLTQLLARANAGTPVIVGFPPERYAGGHLLVLVGGDLTHLRVVDSSGHAYQSLSGAQFWQWWGGFYAILSPASLP